MTKNRSFFSISVYESHSNPAGKGYGNLWVCDTKNIKEIRGFDESFVMFGFEDRDIESRLQTKYNLTTLHSMHIDINLYVIHLSHYRKDSELINYEINRGKWDSNKLRDPVVNDVWGEFYLVKSYGPNINYNFIERLSREL